MTTARSTTSARVSSQPSASSVDAVLRTRPRTYVILAVVWFVVFFILGFVLLASLFAATGAMVSRQEDIGSTTTPVTLLVMVPYFLVVFFNDNPLVIGIMSYVPFSAPVGMPLRIFLGTAQWWEPLVSLAVLAATTFLVIALGARVYERSLLKLGARVSWREAVAG